MQRDAKFHANQTHADCKEPCLKFPLIRTTISTRSCHTCHQFQPHMQWEYSMTSWMRARSPLSTKVERSDSPLQWEERAWVHHMDLPHSLLFDATPFSHVHFSQNKYRPLTCRVGTLSCVTLVLRSNHIIVAFQQKSYQHGYTPHSTQT